MRTCWEVSTVFLLLCSSNSSNFPTRLGSDGGVTARLDAIDVDMLPALLVYRGGELANAEMQLRLDVPTGEEADEGSEPRGGSGSNGEEAQGKQDRVRETDDIGNLADELEDKLDDMGVYG